MMFVIYVGISAAFVASLQTPPNLHTNSNALLESEEFTPPDSTHAPPFVGYPAPPELPPNAYVPPEHDNVTHFTKKENFISTQPPIQNKPLLAILYDGQTTATYSGYDEISFLSDTENEHNSFRFDVEAPIETMRTFCPNTKYCHSETLAETYEDIGQDCCLLCDCSDSCFDVGNCCFDKTNNSQQHQVNPFVSDKGETCVQTFLAGSKFGTNYMNSSFLLFQTCVNNGNEQATMKCLQPNVSSMSEITPVFSHNTEKHYRNIYCAQCNNDSWSATEWQIRLQCNTEANITSTLRVPELTKQSDFSPLQMIASNPSCVMFWDPASHQMEASRCLNNHDIISDCYTPELHDLCKNYYFPLKGGNKIFRNIFCMECLLPSNFTGDYPVCQDVVFTIENIAFSAILSLNENPGKGSRTIVAKDNCPLQRSYNKELDACILHTCSVTEVGVMGNCIPMFSELNGINIDYRLKILYPKNARLMSVSDAQYKDVTLNVVGLSDDMGICWYGVYGTQMVDDFVEVKVQIVKHVGNIQTNVQKSYFELENNIKTYNEQIKNDASAFRLQIDTSEFDPIPDGLMSFAKFTDDLGATACHNKIAFSKMQFCDTITFLENEFKMHDNGNIQIDDVMLIPGEFILRQRVDGKFKSVQVCLDHYTSRHAEVTNRSVIGVRTGHVTLLSALAVSVAISIGQN